MKRQVLIYVRANGVSAFIRDSKGMEKWQREVLEAKRAEDEEKDTLQRMIAYGLKQQRKVALRHV